MPFGWICAAFAAQTGNVSPQTVADQLIVTARQPEFDEVHQIGHWMGGVTAKYGVTTITADDLEVHLAPGERYAIAKGNVHLVDPDGTFTASNLRFSWKDRTGHAEDVNANIAGATIRAKSADITPEVWTFDNVAFTTCRQRIPLYLVKSPKMMVYPGERGKAVHPRISIFGFPLPPLPNYSFNLDPRVRGFRIPTLAYRKRDGFGIGWTSGLLLNENTAVDANLYAFPRSLPGYGFELTRTFVGANLSRAVVTPQSEFAERFYYGYLESIDVATPESEFSFLRSLRKSVSVGSLWNQTVTGRGAPTVYSKAAEFVAEQGGPLGSLGYVSHARVESLREGNAAFVPRIALDTAVEVSPGHLGRSLTTFGRVDASAFFGRRDSGWLRGIVGAAYQPLKQVRLSAGGVLASKGGSPDFVIDRLLYGSGYVLRGDLDLGPTRFSYLTKFDTSAKWYDREYSLSQIVGCLQFNMVYRRFPSDYHIGVQIRIDEFADLLTRRTFQRKAERGKSPTP